MCKVLIKKVEKGYKPATGKRTDGSEWTLHLWDCRVSVDGSEEVTRTVKTFDRQIARSINGLKDGETRVFEADKQAHQSSYEYLIKPKKAFRGKRGAHDQPFGPTNRQQALKIAVARLNASAFAGEVPSPEQIVTEADFYLQWLDAGADTQTGMSAPQKGGRG